MASSEETPVADDSQSVRDILAAGLASDQASSTPRMEKAIDSLVQLLSTTGGNLATVIRRLPLEQRRPLANLAAISMHLRKMPLSAVSPDLAGNFSSQVEQLLVHLEGIANDSPRKHPDELPTLYQIVLSKAKEHAGQAEHFGYQIAGSLAAGVVTDPKLLDETVRVQSAAIRAGAEQTYAMHEEMKRLLDGARESVQSATLAAHAKVFGDEGDSFTVQSRLWLAATILLVALTTFLGYLNLVQVQASAQPVALAASVQVVAAKLFIAGILVASIRASLSQYRAARHNAVVNQHRSRALQSFNALVQASPDPQTKAAVLLQATAGVFGPQPTGYLGRDFEQVAPASGLDDVVRLAKMKDG